MVITEKTFPRGGTWNKDETKPSSKDSQMIFGAVEKSTKKAKYSEKKKLEKLDNEASYQPTSAELLNYETIQDGMNIMGVVKKANNLFLTISLPGRIKARVSVVEISAAYTKITQQAATSNKPVENYKPLDEIFEVGQIVCGRTLEIKAANQTNTMVHVSMSLKPSAVNAELSHVNIEKGFVFIGAIEEIQEHGYVIETGIKGLRAFVPEHGKQNRIVGELIHLKVETVTHGETASNCSCKLMNVGQATVKSRSDCNIDYLLPSTIVQFEVEKLLKDGLQGTIMHGTFVGYINEHQLSTALAIPGDYERNTKMKARVLYVMPFTKLVYLTLNLSKDDAGDSAQLQRGDIVKNAKVHRAGTGGVVLVLKNNYKGLISYRSIRAAQKSNYDQDELMMKYTKGSKHTVRIVDYDPMDSLFICTDDEKKVNEKFFDLKDVKSGEFLTATVVEKYAKVGGYIMRISNHIHGIIEEIFLSSQSKSLDPGAQVQCRVISVDMNRKTVYLTNRSEYMSKKCKVLSELDKAKPNSVYTGTIVSCNEDMILVRFFNNIKGVLKKQYNNDDFSNYFEGQTIPFRINSRKGDQIILALSKEVFAYGEICPVTVVRALESGLEVKVTYVGNSNTEEGQFDDELQEEIEINGIIPMNFLSDYGDLVRAKLDMCAGMGEMKAVYMTHNIFSLRDMNYFLKNPTNNWSNLTKGDILKATVRNVGEDVIDLVVPVQGYGKLVKVHRKMLLLEAVNSVRIGFVPDQVVYVKVLSKETTTKTMTVSCKLTDVWDGDLKLTAGSTEEYLKEVDGIRKKLKKHKDPIAVNFKIGNKVKGKFIGIDVDTGDWHFEAEKTKTLIIVRTSIVGKAQVPTVGNEMECVIIWIDYSSRVLYGSNKAADCNHFTNADVLPENLIGKVGINAKVLLKLDNIFICSLKKGKFPLVYCPTRLHCNDFERTCSVDVREGSFCKLAFVHEKMPIAVLEHIWKMWTGIVRKRKAQEQLEALIPEKKIKIYTEPFEPSMNKNAKRKRSASETQVTGEPEKSSVLFYEDKTSADVSEPIKAVSKKEESIHKPVVPALSGISSFWNSSSIVEQSKENTVESSEEDDSDENDGIAERANKRVKSSATAKFKKQSEEEQRLCSIEQKYADPNQLPESVDEFDRLVMSEPNNSKHWINYMVFHMKSTELEKARAVARRALKQISFRKQDELLNIWMALLNFELRYGNKESYDETVKEALTYNEPVSVYLRLIDILSDAERKEELIETIDRVTKKFKANEEMWRVVANAFFTIGMVDRAQQTLQKALVCLPERQHVNTIVAFANLNQKHGQPEMAQTLLDQIVTSYPKRVDVWTQYVDILLKEQLVDSARSVLERAVIQKIPMKKMRTIFKKYVEFEQAHGNENSVNAVKEMAANLAKKSVWT